MSSRVLVTGSESGLGKFICEQMAATGLNRRNSDQVMKMNDFDVIIHCAFSKAVSTPVNGDTTVKSQNLLLTERLLQLRHKKFVFISSCDVYPEDNNIHSENELISISTARSPYARQKLECEKLVESNAVAPVIFRPVSLIGSAVRNENLRRLIEDTNPTLTLTDDSTWNFVKYDEILAASIAVFEKSVCGKINICRTSPIEVREVAALLGRKPTYGNFRYKVPLLNGEMAVELVPALNETSHAFMERWVQSQK